MLDVALAPSTWRRYRSSLVRFRDFCWEREIAFPPVGDDTTSAIANFLELITRTTRRPAATINTVTAAINTLYEPLDQKPTLNPLIRRLRRALVRNRTTRPIEHGQAFDLSTLTELFTEWGSSLTLERLRAKLIALLCVLGALRVSAVILPRFGDVRVTSSEGIDALVVPVVGYKNDKYGEGNTITIYQCSDRLLCPVTTFKEWRRRTAHLRDRVRDCRIVFETSPPYDKLSAGRCAAILKGVAQAAGLDTRVFTARTFRKSGVMAGINADVNPDAIFRLGGWRDPNTFWGHYVTRTIPNTYTDLLFDVTAQELSDDDGEEEDS